MIDVLICLFSNFVFRIRTPKTLRSVLSTKLAGVTLYPVHVRTVWTQT